MRLLLGLSCLVLAVGCSDDDKVRRLPDAPPPPDADVDAATFGPVILTILEGTAPQSNVRVIFQNADSSIVLETTTGTDGKASAMMMPGGFVTAIDPFPNRPQGVQSSDLRTFAGVKPGDQLNLFAEDFVSPPAINVDVILPINSTALEYRVSTNCNFGFLVSGGTGSGSGTPTAQLQLSGCGPTSNLLVEALGAGSQPFESIFKQNVALVANGTIDLTADTYTAVPDSTFTYSNIPSGISSVSINAVRATSLGSIFQLNEFTGVTAGAATFTAKIPTITNATGVTASSFFANSTQHLITEWGPVASTYALDAAASFLPDFADRPALDTATHKVAWTTSGGSVQPDFVYLTTYLGREVPAQNWRWSIVAPGGSQAVLPVLPAAAATYNPIDGDFASYDLRTGKVPGGYDAVRANILSTESFEKLVIGASGKAAFNFFIQVKAVTAPPTVPTNTLRGLRRR